MTQLLPARRFHPSAGVDRSGALLALLVVAADAISSLAGHPNRTTAAAVLLLAPGMALIRFIPGDIRCRAARLALIPLISSVVSSILVITLVTVSVSLSATSIRVAIALVALAALCVPRSRSSATLPPLGAADIAGLLSVGAALTLGLFLQLIVVGARPLPGQDWGHYLMYVEEIRKHHTLLATNPYWMLGGLPFPEDPGVPSLYSAFALLSHQPTASLAQYILVFSLLAILSVFVLAATLWGVFGGVVAAGVLAVTPMSLDMLAWHGLANEYALDIIPLTLLPVALLFRGVASRTWAGFFGLTLIGLAAAHRLSLLFVVAAVASAMALAARHFWRRILAFLFDALLVLPLGAGVIIYLGRQAVAVGPIQSDPVAFASTHVNWGLVNRDISPELTGAGLSALVAFLVLRRLRVDPVRHLLFGYALAVLLFGYAWLGHLPMAYYRAPYYLPVAVAAAVGAAAARIPVPSALSAAGAAFLIAFVAADAHDLAPVYRNFYTFVDRGSLSALGYVDQRVPRRGVVVTDTCWGFLSGWLLQRRVIAAQDPALILPNSEVKPSRLAQEILYGGRKTGATLASRLNARFALVDPLCTHQDGQPVQPPDIGTPVYASSHLVVLKLSGSQVRHPRG